MNLVKKALITGGSEGIGRSLAIKLKAQGYVITALGTEGHDFLIADLATKARIEKVEHLAENKFDLLIKDSSTQSKFHTRAGGSNAQISSWASQTPDQVVNLALKDLSRRKYPIVVSGPQKYAVFFSRLRSEKVK